MTQDGNQEGLPVLPPVPNNLKNSLLVNVSSSPTAIDTLLKQDPDRMLDLANKQLENEAKYEEHRHAEEKEREEHRHAEEKGRQSIVFSALAVVMVIFLAAFVYSGMTTREGLSEKVINTMLGVLGGGGGVAAVLASANRRNNP